MVENRATPQKGLLCSRVRTHQMRSDPLTREGHPRQDEEEG